jgi:hypothetical protein
MANAGVADDLLELPMALRFLAKFVSRQLVYVETARLLEIASGLVEPRLEPVVALAA